MRDGGGSVAADGKEVEERGRLILSGRMRLVVLDEMSEVGGGVDALGVDGNVVSGLHDVCGLASNRLNDCGLLNDFCVAGGRWGVMECW